MRKNIIYLSAILILNSCNLPEMKKLNKESEKELQSIINELNIENFQYSYHSKTENGKSKSFFSVKLSNIDDSADFRVYNDRIISAFEKSGFEFEEQDFIRISYFKKLFALDYFVYYEINPKTRRIIKEGTK
jgi:hypothetical protein